MKPTRFQQMRKARAEWFKNVFASMLAHQCERYDYRPEELLAGDRGSLRIQHARHHLWYSLHEAGLAYSEIARLVGRKHPSVLRACVGMKKKGWTAIPVATEDGCRVAMLQVAKDFLQTTKARRVSVAGVMYDLTTRFPTRKDEHQRARWEGVREAMAGLSEGQAVRLWAEFCRHEWPHSWERQAAQMPRGVQFAVAA